MAKTNLKPSIFLPTTPIKKIEEKMGSCKTVDMTVKFIFWTDLFQVKIQPWPWSDNNIYIVSCRGVVKPGGADPWYNQGGPIKVGACKSFLFALS